VKSWLANGSKTFVFASVDHEVAGKTLNKRHFKCTIQGLTHFYVKKNGHKKEKDNYFNHLSISAFPVSKLHSVLPLTSRVFPRYQIVPPISLTIR